MIFGVPVSLNIRDKLQALTFGAGACVGAEALECQPSLTTKQLAAIYSRNGQYGTWTALKSRVTAGQDAGNVIAPLASNTVFICRRSNTSGTQATFQTHFFKQNCGIANSAVFAPLNAATPQVISNGGSPAVISCLETRQTNNEGGIGILSTEFQPGPGARLALHQGQRRPAVSAGRRPWRLRPDRRSDDAVAHLHQRNALRVRCWRQCARACRASRLCRT